MYAAPQKGKRRSWAQKTRHQERKERRATPATGSVDFRRNQIQQHWLLERLHQIRNQRILLSWDESVATNDNVQIIGYVSGVSDDPWEDVLMEFRQYLGIMSQEAADRLPEHRPYDCKIDLKEGTTAPWGPIYPLFEVELQILRDWLKEMEKTGEIRKSTSPVGSPILFVPKPNG